MTEKINHTEYMKIERAPNPVNMARELGKLDERKLKKLINLMLGCCYLYVCLMAAYL